MESVESIISLFEPFYDQDATPIDEIYPGPCFPRIEIRLLNDLFNLSKETLKKNKALLEISSPMIVVGDLHGNLVDFLKILYYFGTPPKSRYLFLGDFVDRGRYSVNVISLILALMVKYPNDIYLIRGNHEFSHINRAYGFFDECMNTYGTEIVWNQFQEVFSYFPLAAVIGSSVFCVHGGLSPLLKSIDSIRNLPLPIPNYFNNTMISDLVWSDPVDTVRGFQLNHRGSGQIFGPDVVEDFLRYNKLKIMIRGHQCTLAGFKPFASFMGITVFSSSNYCSSICNKCGVVSIKDRDVSFYNIEESEMGISPSASMCLPIDGDVGLKRIFRTISRPDFHKEISPTPINSPLQQGQRYGEEEEEEDEDEFQIENQPKKPFQQQQNPYSSSQQYNTVMQMRVNMILNQQQQLINNSIIQNNVPTIPSQIEQKGQQNQQQEQNEKKEENEKPSQDTNSENQEIQKQPEEEKKEQAEPSSEQQQQPEEENKEKVEPEQQQEENKEKVEPEQQQDQENNEKVETEQQQQQQQEENNEKVETEQQQEENKEKVGTEQQQEQENKEKVESNTEQQQPEEESKAQGEQQLAPQASEQQQEVQQAPEQQPQEPSQEEPNAQPEEESKEKVEPEPEQQPQQEEAQQQQEEQNQQEQQPQQEEQHEEEEEKKHEEQQQEQSGGQDGQPKEDQSEQPEPGEQSSAAQEHGEAEKDKERDEQTREAHTPKVKHVKLALPPAPKTPGSPSQISVTFGNEPRTTHQNFLQRSQSVMDSLGGV